MVPQEPWGMEKKRGKEFLKLTTAYCSLEYDVLYLRQSAYLCAVL